MLLGEPTAVSHLFPLLADRTPTSLMLGAEGMVGTFSTNTILVEYPSQEAGSH